MVTASGSKKERVLANLEELDFQNFLPVGSNHGGASLDSEYKWISRIENSKSWQLCKNPLECPINLVFPFNLSI